MQVVVTHASRYNFMAEGTGEVLRGCKLKVVNFTSRDDGDDKKGAIVLDKVSCPFDVFETLKDVPGVYDLTMRESVKQGQLVQVFDSIKFLSPLTAEALMGGKAPKASA